MNRLDPATIGPAELGLMLAQLMEVNPAHELVVAARLALEIGASRAQAPLNLDDYIGGRFHRQNELAEHTAVQKARYGPTGDRDQWVAPREGDYQGTAQRRAAA
jgi:hypothetical protein